MTHDDATLTNFNQAIAQDPKNSWALAHRGETYRLLARYQEALADFDQAIVLNPDYAWAFAHRGETYRLMNRYDEALADFNRAIVLNPDYAWAFACRCLIYEKMRRYEEALQDFDRTLALDKTIFSAWPSDRGLLLSFCGRYEEAIVWCEQQLRETPDDPLLLYALAVTKARQQGLAGAKQQINRAQAALQAAVKTDATGAILYRLGGLAALEGETEQALHYLQEATTLRGDRFETARHDLAWLDLRADARFQALVAET